MGNSRVRLKRCSPSPFMYTYKNKTLRSIKGDSFCNNVRIEYEENQQLIASVVRNGVEGSLSCI